MSTTPPASPLFTSTPPERTRLPLAAAGLAILLVLAAIAALLHKPATQPSPTTQLPPDPYAVHLTLDQIAMSESTSLSGGKSTFIDGRILNTGAETVTGATVQIIFRNDVQLPPQVETQTLMLIRTHQPYIDTQTLAATPLHPGEPREFRLTFDSIGSNWNGQIPEIRITRVTSR